MPLDWWCIISGLPWISPFTSLIANYLQQPLRNLFRSSSVVDEFNNINFFTTQQFPFLQFWLCHSGGMFLSTSHITCILAYVKCHFAYILNKLILPFWGCSTVGPKWCTCGCGGGLTHWMSLPRLACTWGPLRVPMYSNNQHTKNWPQLRNWILIFKKKKKKCWEWTAYWHWRSNV